MTFPDRRYASAQAYAKAYFDELTRALNALEAAAMDAAAALLEQAYQDARTVFVCGNGGAAAIAGHFACDHGKGVRAGTGFFPRVRCLGADMPLLTAIANDISYEEVFSFPLEADGREGDVLFAISASGSSPNVLRALRTAQGIGMKTIAVTGFDGGKATEFADIHIHVPADNYGVIEDVQQAVMQMLAQYVRLKHLDVQDVEGTVF